MDNEGVKRDKDIDSESDFVPIPITKSKEYLIDLYLEQKQSLNPSVHFDEIAVTASNEKTILLSSKGLHKGVHEWNIEIWSLDVDLQEIGVIGTNRIQQIPISDSGIIGTDEFES